MCTLLKAMHSVYYEKDTACPDAEMGGRLRDTAAQAVKQATADIASSGLPCAHVVYNELVASPLDTVRKIYASFGWTVSAEYEKRIGEYMVENNAKRAAIKAKQQKQQQASSSGGGGGDSNHKHPAQAPKGSVTGLHTHKPETFGLTAEELTSGEFDTYIKKYKLEKAF